MATKKAAKKKVAKKKVAKKKVAKKKVAKKKAATNKKKSAKSGSPEKPGLSALLGRALTDDKFRGDLFRLRDKTLGGYDLSARDLDALSRLDRKTLEDQAKRLGGGVNALTIKVVISKSF